MESRLRSFGFLLKDLTRRHVQRFEQHASRINLTLMQCKAMVWLEKHEGVSQARLAELTDVDPMTMVRILDRMEADGLVERRLDPNDRRARQLYLTDKARPLVATVWDVSDVTREELFAGVNDDDLSVFFRVLEHIHGNATALTGTPCESGSSSGGSVRGATKPDAATLRSVGERAAQQRSGSSSK